MADGDGQEGAQGGAATGLENKQTTTPPTTEKPNTNAGQEGGEEFDKERAMATIKKLREFEKTAKTSLKELEDLRAAQKAIEDAKLSESERTQKRIAELEQGLQQTKAEAEAQVAAEKAAREKAEAEAASERRASRVAKIAGSLGAHDPHDANILAATSGVDATAQDAEAKISAAIAELKKSRPYLFKAAGGRLESFNPGNDANGVAETDAQKVARLRSQTQSGKGLFG